jgi:hypothetical protein
MGTYYEFKGTLTFASEADAEWAFTKLRDDRASVFWVPEEVAAAATHLLRKGSTLEFSTDDFSSGDSFYHSCEVLKDVVSKAIDGRVRVQSGDGDAGTEVYQYVAKKNKATKAESRTRKNR